jgi:NAD(P)-dependent dehydrogenase (short-subunit alcohol dehydrogenase family)
VTDTPAIRQVVTKAFTDLGKIDVVVNNAGYGLFGAAEEVTDEQITHQINTNLIGPIQAVRAALPHLRAQGGGRIIQLTTYGGQAAFPGGSLYHAGKWGIEGFMESMMQELAPFNIGVTLVEPGGARTEFRFGSAKLGPKMDAYDGTPAGMTRTLLQETSRLPNGDPAKMVRLMIDSVDQNPAPKRIVLGSDSYTVIQRALTERLAAVEAQKGVMSLPPILSASRECSGSSDTRGWPAPRARGSERRTCRSSCSPPPPTWHPGGGAAS